MMLLDCAFDNKESHVISHKPPSEHFTSLLFIHLSPFSILYSPFHFLSLSLFTFQGQLWMTVNCPVVLFLRTRR